MVVVSAWLEQLWADAKIKLLLPKVIPRTFCLFPRARFWKNQGQESVLGHRFGKRGSNGVFWWCFRVFLAPWLFFLKKALFPKGGPFYTFEFGSVWSISKRRRSILGGKTVERTPDSWLWAHLQCSRALKSQIRTIFGHLGAISYILQNISTFCASCPGRKWEIFFFLAEFWSIIMFLNQNLILRTMEVVSAGLEQLISYVGVSSAYIYVKKQLLSLLFKALQLIQLIPINYRN